MTIQHTQTQIANKMSLSQPGLLLRMEGLIAFAAALALYAHLGFGWLAFAIFLLAPDLTFVFYAVDKRLGSLAYNLAHFQAFPVLLGLAGVILTMPILMQIGLIWWAHIAMDRTVGYGLKYSGQFKETHLQRV